MGTVPPGLISWANGRVWQGLARFDSPPNAAVTCLIHLRSAHNIDCRTGKSASACAVEHKVPQALVVGSAELLSETATALPFFNRRVHRAFTQHSVRGIRARTGLLQIKNTHIITPCTAPPPSLPLADHI